MGRLPWHLHQDLIHGCHNPAAMLSRVNMLSKRTCLSSPQMVGIQQIEAGGSAPQPVTVGKRVRLRPETCRLGAIANWETLCAHQER